MRNIRRRLDTLSLAVALAGVAATPNVITASSFSTQAHCDLADLSMFQTALFVTGDLDWDLGGDGMVGLSDLALVQVCNFD